MSTSKLISPENTPLATASSSDLIASIKVGSDIFRVDLGRGIDLSIPMSFGEADPNLYGIPPSVKTTFEVEEMIGDTTRGGPCNVDTVTLTPHCHGTHTESIGHILNERRNINRVAPLGMLPCTIISIHSESLMAAAESSRPALSRDDIGITKRLLEQELDGCGDEWLTAVLIRTLPNEPGKLAKKYIDNTTPFFSTEAIAYLAERGVEHILVDLPSLDRLHDQGEMAAHRTWWHIEKGEHLTRDGAHNFRTITELIFIPNEVLDGPGLVSIQIPSFESDAAPSRPIFYPVLDVSAS
ncbi:MAG: cyclase family protein [Bacteroidetes bacterium]|nr:cyclase family protein [Bacteroidota bacterium]